MGAAFTSVAEMVKDSFGLYSRLQQEFPTLARLYSHCMSMGCWLTTSYSGVGTPEYVASVLTDGFRLAGGGEGRHAGFQLYSACDVAPLAREAIMNHRAKSAPAHVFGDLLGRVSESDEKKVRALVGCTFGKQVTDQPAVASDGAEVKAELIDIFRNASWRETCYCYTHSKQCSLNPPSEPGQPRYRMEVAGVTCVAWSSMRRSKFGGWYHESAAAAVAEAFYIRKSRPTWVVIECVRAFDARGFMDIVSEDGLYAWVSLVFSPKHLGVPSSRARKYTVAWCLAELGTVTDLNPEVFFWKFFGRAQTFSSAIYMKASKERVAVAKLVAAQSKGVIVDDSVAARLPWNSILAGALRQRLQSYSEAYQKHVEDGGQSLSSSWIDLNQTFEFTGRLDDVAPALLKKHFIYDLIAKRPVMPEELWLAMGWPVRNVVWEEGEDMDAFAQAHWPWVEEMHGLVVDKYAGLLGNGMHCNAIASIMFFAMAVSCTSSADREQVQEILWQLRPANS